MAKHSKKGVSVALVAGSALALMGAAAGSASADPLDYGDVAVRQTAPEFRLNAWTLEPGCFQLGRGSHHLGVDVDAHIDVTERTRQAHIRVTDANFSIDQALIPGYGTGYQVYNTFDTGSISTDADIDNSQEATDLAAPGGANVDHRNIIVCVSDHPDGDQNEPYVDDGLDGEVAAINRPIIQPTIASLGMSVLTSQQTYKVGFGYEVQRGYDSHWRKLFLNDWVIGPGSSFGDPMAWDTDGDQALDHVLVFSRSEQAGVRRFNDVDEYGEKYNSGTEKSSYGQPIWFDVSGTGDPEAYLHKALPGVVDGGFPPLDSIIEAAADQTDSVGLHTFSAEGDLPLSWSVKASLAPERYGKQVTMTDDMFRAWNTAWQKYYTGDGPKPALPLAPGTKSPDPLPHITLKNPQLEKTETGEVKTITIVQQVPAAPATPAQPQGSVLAAKKATKTTVRAKLMRGSNGRFVQVHVRSDAKKARIVLQLRNAKNRTVKMTMKTVSTNKDVRIMGLKVGKQVKSVKATVAG